MQDPGNSDFSQVVPGRSKPAGDGDGEMSVEGFKIVSLHEDSLSSQSQRPGPEGARSSSPIEEEDRGVSVTRPNSVAVRYRTGWPLGENRRMLQMYFETTCLSKGGSIRNTRLSFDKRTLFITFENPLSVEFREKDHTYKDLDLLVIPLEPETADWNYLSQAIAISLAGKDRDFVKTASPQVHNYLRHLRAEITEQWLNKKDDTWVYTLNDPADMERIFENGSSELDIDVDGVRSTLYRIQNDVLEPWVDGLAEADRFLMTSLPPEVSEEELKSFIEERSTNTVASIDLRPGRALVTLDNPIDFRGLARAVHTFPLKGYMCGIQRVPLSLSLLLSECAEETEEDLKIKLHYFAQRCPEISGEQLFAGIEFLDETKKMAIVKFVDRQVLNVFLAHCEQIGTLSLYHECLEDGQIGATSESPAASTPAASGTSSGDAINALDKDETLLKCRGN